ncbi:8310_t:CDS:2 [Diversispora eburnea]|uniref:8310_t:CDS:1 n=1 Tax=Diversispora eburnea TaxID=1213867 RepID=A0A9N8VE35_9GLOM|nr:8310_t:CDS:2 [Diversispora eburnea]
MSSRASSPISPLDSELSVGSSYDLSTHSVILVNDDANPLFIDTPYFVGRICVRVRDFKGIVPPGKTRRSSSPYFEGNKEQYSIQVQGRFKGEKWTADNIIFGNDFDRKINLPPISRLGLKIMKWIDPCLETDIYNDKPWAYSPLLYTVNVLRVEYDELTSDHNNYLPPWPSYDGRHIKEGIINSSDNVSKRKKYFSSEENRKKFEINENQVWNFDFCNSYIDFNNIAVKIPGIKIGILQYWDGQPFRYVCKSRDSSVVFFVITFQLLEVNEEEKFSDPSQQSEVRSTKVSNQLLKYDQYNEPSLTPKSSARWASVKSPSSVLFSNSQRQIHSMRNSIPSSPSPGSVNIDESSENEEDIDI